METIIFGKNPVLYTLENARECVLEVLLAKKVDKQIFAKFRGLKITILDSKKAQSLARGGNHQGMFLKIKSPSAHSFNEIKKLSSLIVLCEISDVSNIGSIIRSAYALGVGGVIFTHDISRSISGIIRASSGALINLPFAINRNPLDIAHELKMANFHLFGADMDGISVANSKSNEKFAIFLGSEGIGLSCKIKTKMDTILKVDMARDFDSLNVSVSAGILMYNLLNKDYFGSK